MRTLLTEEQRKERARESALRWRNKPGNREKAAECLKKWYDNGGKEKKAEYQKKYIKTPATLANLKRYHSNPEVRSRKNARTALENVKRIKHKNCTPAWYDKELCIDYYLEAIEAEGKHEVDHIVPIRSDTVCGLNVHYNLQVLKLKVNRRKNNEYDSDMILPMDEQHKSLNYKAKGAQQ